MQRNKHQNPDITNTGDLLRRCAYGSEETKRQSQRSTIFADKPMQVCLPHDKTRVRNRRRLKHRGKQRREEPSRLPRSRRLIYVREIMALRVECTDEVSPAGRDGSCCFGKEQRTEIDHYCIDPRDSTGLRRREPRIYQIKLPYHAPFLSGAAT